MAVAASSVPENKFYAIQEWRENAIIKILNESKKKNWCEAEKLYDDYKEYCEEPWYCYDTLFNYKFNKCGFCTRMKRVLVKSKWSCAEDYPLYKHLVCVNRECEFFLIINSDKDKDSD